MKRKIQKDPNGKRVPFNQLVQSMRENAAQPPSETKPHEKVAAWFSEQNAEIQKEFARVVGSAKRVDIHNALTGKTPVSEERLGLIVQTAYTLGYNGA